MRRLDLLLAAKLLTLLVQLLPDADRRATLRDWLADGEAAQRPLWEAVKTIPAAWRMRQPYRVDPADEVPVSRKDRAALAFMRLNIHLLSGFLVFTILLGLLLTPTVIIVQWSLQAAMAVTVLQWLAWRGLDWDCPWLRSTAAGSLVQLSAVLGPMIVLTLLPGTNSAANALTLCWTFLVMSWDVYWSVQRPLRRRGIARLFTRRS